MRYRYVPFNSKGDAVVAFLATHLTYTPAPVARTRLVLGEAGAGLVLGFVALPLYHTHYVKVDRAWARAEAQAAAASAAYGHTGVGARLFHGQGLMRATTTSA